MPTFEQTRHATVAALPSPTPLQALRLDAALDLLSDALSSLSVAGLRAQYAAENGEGRAVCAYALLLRTRRFPLLATDATLSLLSAHVWE